MESKVTLYHEPVLLEESIAGLNIRSDGVYIDATLGGGGHANKILEVLGEKGKLILLDVDAEALIQFKMNNHQDQRIQTYMENFRDIDRVLSSSGIKKVDGIIADLGVSSHQIDTKNRGFSYMDDSAPLDMRLDKSQRKTAADIVNRYSEEELYKVFYELGEVKHQLAKGISSRVVTGRKQKRIKLAGDLKSIITNNDNANSRKTRLIGNIFRAIRMEVNEELDCIAEFLPRAIQSLNKGGRLVMISFHSLEDRMIKRYFKQESLDCICPTERPICNCEHKKRIIIINKKVIKPSIAEKNKNIRARSAKLRIVEKL